MKLIALKDFNLDGSKKLKSGEEFDISEASARFLIATSHAKIAAQPIHQDKQPHSRKDVRAES